MKITKAKIKTKLVKYSCKLQNQIQMKKLLLLVMMSITLITFSQETKTIIVVPATPKSTIVKPFRAMFGIEDEIANYIKLMVKQGYIVKTIAIIDDESWSKGVVIMEKY